MARQFVVRLLVNGVSPAGCHVERFVVEATRYARCGTAEIVLAVEPGGSPWFLSSGSFVSDIVLDMRDQSESASSWVSVFRGGVDHVEWHPDRGQMVLECRDYLARLVDMRVRQSWLNLEGAELVQEVIAAAGLMPDVMLPGGMTGQFWQIEHKRTAMAAQNRFQTAFDLVSFLAREAQCDLYMDGLTAVCRPLVLPGDADAVVRDVSSGVILRNIRYDLTISQGVVVHVASWDSRQRTRTEIFYDGVSWHEDMPDTGTALYSFRVPGRRAEDVRAIALGKYNRIVAHGSGARVRIPGVVGMLPRQFLIVEAGGAALSIDAVTSRFSCDGGFIQDVVMRNRALGAVA